jgi:PAS domain S-box-containing protein
MTDSLPVQANNPILPANETERLAALYRYQVLDTPPEVAFDRITALAARLFKTPTVLISLVDESRVWFKSSIGFGTPEVCRNDALCNVAILSDEPLIVPDTLLDDRLTCNPFVQGEPATRFYAGAPLIDQNGFNLGALCLLDTVPHAPLTAEEEATLVDLAAMVVDELELRLAAQQIASVDAALVEITQGVSRVTGQNFFDELVKHFAKVLGTDYVYIGLVEGTEPKMMRTIATCDRGNIVENLEYRLQDTPCWEAIEQRKICCHPRNVKAQFPNAVLLQLLPVESYIAIPFYGADGHILGLLGVMDGKPLANVQLAESLLTIFASRIATELERQQSESILVEQTRLLEAVSTGQPLDQCLSEMCSSIAKLSPNTRACVLLTDDLRTKFPRSITPDFPPSLSQGLKDAPINELAIGTCGTAVYCSEPVTCADIASDDRWSAGWRDLFIAHDIRACHSLPIMGIDNLPLGSVMLCFNEARSPTAWEYKLGEFGTKIASITIDRKRSIEKLSENEERLSLALTAAEMATCDADLSTGKTIWSAKHFEILGYAPAPDGAATLDMVMSLIHPDDRAAVTQVWETAQRDRSIFRSENRFVRADTGAVVWLAATGRFLDNQAGEAMRFIGVLFDISLRKQTEIALVESQQFVQKIANTMPGMLYVYDLIEQRNIYSNRHSLELVGYTPEQLEELGTDITPTIVHPDNVPRAMAYQAQFNTALPGEVLEIEYRVLQANDEWCWLLSRSTVFNTTPAGDVQQILGVSIDITDRKRAEEELRQSQALVQRQLMEIEAIYQTAPIGLTIFDRQLRYVRINQRLAEMNGIAAEDHIGRTLREIVPTVADENEPLMHSVFATGEPLLNLEISGETLAAPGVQRTWIENCYPLRDETGQVVAINIVVQEITDRKRAELAIQEGKAKLNYLLAAAEFGDWDLNLADGTAFRSLQHDRIFGYESLLAEWTYDMFMEHVLPEDRAGVDRQYQYAIANNEPWDFECQIRRADNQVRWIWASGYVYHDAQGVATRMLGLVADISLRKNTELALAERNQDLISFAYTVSHDLKAPLRAISNLSVWIEEDLEGKLPPDTQAQFDLLRTRVKRMESMIDSLLLYARAGRQEAQLETFDFAELLAEIIDSLAPPEGFRIDIQPPLPTLTTKRIFLSQVCANLVSNAIKHHNSVEGHLQISAIEHPSYHEFIIKDDGPGIAPEHHAKVFDVFQTFASNENSASTGIGLAIVKKIVETEQGTIRLESSLGQGTTFYVTWPKSHG